MFRVVKFTWYYVSCMVHRMLSQKATLKPVGTEIQGGTNEYEWQSSRDGEKSIFSIFYQ